MMTDIPIEVLRNCNTTDRNRKTVEHGISYIGLITLYGAETEQTRAEEK